MSSQKFIPALRYKPLTRLYDFFLAITFPEKKIKQALINQLQIKGNESVLDFGCDTATLSIMIKESHPDVTITGVDVDDRILSIAKTKIDRKGLQIQLEKYDGENLSFPGHRHFDIIVSSLVFHHIPTTSKRKLLVQLYYLIKPGGRLHIADFGKPSNLYSKVAFGIFRRFDGEENTRVNARGQLPAFISEAGFSDTQETINFNTAFGTVVLIKAAKHAI